MVAHECTWCHWTIYAKMANCMLCISYRKKEEKEKTPDTGQCCGGGVYKAPGRMESEVLTSASQRTKTSKFKHRLLPHFPLHMEVRTWGLSQKSSLLWSRGQRKYLGRHTHTPERMPVFRAVTVCAMLSVRLSSQAGVTRCYLWSASRTGTVRTKTCSSAKDKRLQTDLHSKAMTQATAGQQGQKDKEHSGRL